MPGRPGAMALRLAAGLWATACVSSGSAPPSTTPGPGLATVTPAAAPSGSISGLVIVAGVGGPVDGARVEVRSIVLASPRVVTSGSDGRYEVGALPEGTYRLLISRDGFVPRVLGASRASPGLELRRDAPHQSVNVALAREATLIGRVLGDDGTPRAGIVIRALRPRVEDGQLVLAVHGSATTDHDGRFRVGGLRGGDYYVDATEPAAGRAPTYYPGIVSPQDAARVPVPGGQTMTGIEFRLQSARVVTVSGQITAHDRQRLTAGSVAMTARVQTPLSRSLGSAVTLQPDGTFLFRNVAPGDYVVRARGETGKTAPWLFGQFALGVAGDDLHGLRVVLNPGARVSGRIDLNRRGGRTLSPDELTAVRIRAVATAGAAFGDALSQAPDAAGEFRFRGIMPGGHVFRVEGLPDPWSLEAVYLMGREVTDTPVFLESGQQNHSLRVVVTDVSTLVTGRVLDAAGQEAVSDVVVVAFAADPARWHWYSRHLGLARADVQGAYRLSGLPAGDYLVIATEDVDEGDPLDTTRLTRLAVHARRLTLPADARLTLDLPVVSVHLQGDVRGGR